MAKKRKTSAAATTKKTAKKVPNSSGRKLEIPKYKSFKLQKRIKHPSPKLPGAFRLFRRSLGHIRQHWKLFGGISLVYLLLTVFLVQSFGFGGNLTELKATVEEFFAGTAGQLTTGFALFGYLLQTTGTAPSDIAGAYRSILLLLASLALIWALRQTYAGAKTTVKESYYRSTYPLIPFLLVLFVVGLQLLPLLIANSLYGFVFGEVTLAVTGAEKIIFITLFFLLGVLSIYMVTSSIFALYIVTLPDMTPIKALRSARELVRYRRFTVIRKLIFLPVILLVISAFIIVPMILYVTPLAEFSFFVLTIVGLAVVHSYLYALYRELL